jgi:hypothetical protein
MKELSIIQTKLNAPKNQRNNFGNYNYRSCEDILEALKPLLKETGCTVTISDGIELIGDRYYVKATATIKNANGESESATAYAREPLTRKGMDDSQITGASSSYCRKYALNGLFCIDDNKDPDAVNEHDGTINQSSAPQAPSGRGRKKQTQPQQAPVQTEAPVQQHFDTTLAYALQQLSLVADVNGIQTFWGQWRGKLSPTEESQLVDAIHALPFYPKQ